MRINRIARTALMAGILCLAATGAQADDDRGAKDDDKKQMEHKMKFVCPVHKEADSDKPGDCPKCGKKLVPMGGPMHHQATPGSHAASTIAIEVTPSTGLVLGERADMKLTLKTADGKPVAFADLKESHNKKIHLLIVDPSLTDYRHEHPTETSTAGKYAFAIKPKAAGAYKVFAELVPKATGQREYATATFTVAGSAAPVAKTTTMDTTAGGFKFAIALENPEVKAGEPSTITLKVAGREGKPLNRLEPIMGSFAHLVAFSADRSTASHFHPQGSGPEKDNDRGGPNVKFPVEFREPGFHKLFAQVRIDGNDVVAPFGIEVLPRNEKPAAATGTLSATRPEAKGASEVRGTMSDKKDNAPAVKKPEQPKESSNASGEKGIIHAKNTICPISGKLVGSMEEGAHVDYKGYRVGLCCMSCKKAFEADPEANLKKALNIQ